MSDIIHKIKKTPTSFTTILQITFIFFIAHCLYSNKPLKHALQLKKKLFTRGQKKRCMHTEHKINNFQLPFNYLKKSHPLNVKYIGKKNSSPHRIKKKEVKHRRNFLNSICDIRLNVIQPYRFHLKLF